MTIRTKKEVQSGKGKNSLRICISSQLIALEHQKIHRPQLHNSVDFFFHLNNRNPLVYFTMGSVQQQPVLATKPVFPAEATAFLYAQSLDAKDPLRSYRSKFTIPSKDNIKAKKVVKPGSPHLPCHHVRQLTTFS